MHPRTPLHQVLPDIRLLTSLDESERDGLATALGALDYPVAGVATGHLLIESYLRRAPDRAWALFRGDEPVGAFAVVPYLELPGTQQTSTYLVPSVRGTGLNTAVKRATIVAARAHAVPLYSSIHHANARSLAATRGLFVSIDPVKVFEHSTGRLAWRFDLGDPWAQLAAGPAHPILEETVAGAFHAPSQQAA
ncbi:hypothetical protein [Cryobacterium arcticum]|uniref:hypothetical protein n=1 Tax=Cryobacterium arcticum TaxID=670052 RepID=UPI00082CA85A|nr:hypothetical protein [Cryobacterium arcticum]